MEKKYYLHNGTIQEGPFDVNDLKAKGINKDTHIWFEGISDWTATGNIEELKGILQSATPPPFTKGTSQPKSEQIAKPAYKFWRVLQILSGIILFWIVIMVGINIYSSSHRNGDGLGSTYKEKVLTVEEIEKADPAKFLETGGKYNETFWGDNFKIAGTIKNNATVANYKDVVIVVIFYSETDTELKRENYTIYQFCPAHSIQTFELKVSRPRACKKLGLATVRATPY